MPTQKTRVRDFLVITALSFLIIAILELSMALAYKMTNLKYFGSKIELFDLGTGRTKTSRNALINKKSTKVAVFGGSSSVGFASPINFAGLLNNPDYSIENLHVTNYGGAGAPFSGDQAEMAKAVMSQYDIIIIYSGHNEMWEQINSRPSFKESLPNGHPITPTRIVNANRKIRLRLASQSLGLQPPSFSSEEKEWPRVYNFFNLLLSNSRTFWFSKRAAKRINNALFRQDDKIRYPKKFFYNEMFLSTKERKNLVDLYKENITHIARRLKPNQKLVLSTVLSNDLVRPIADFTEGIAKNKTSEDEKNTKGAYSYLMSKNYVSLSSQLEKIPPGANKRYLEGMLCLSKVEFKGKSASNCFSKLKEARRFDAFPGRVLPEINTFIRNYSHKNVIVVDPVESLNTKVKSIKEYHSYFVDIHHPSSLGHILIAEKIMEGVFLEFPSHRKYKVDECGNIEFVKGNQVVFIKTSPDRCANSKNENIVWLKKFMAAQPISYPYNMFKLRAEASLNQVGKNSRLLNNSEF